MGIGATEPWHQIVQSTSEVYLFRAQGKGIVPPSARDMLAFVRAVGKAQGAHLDVRAVGLWLDGDKAMLDVVMTSSFMNVDPSFSLTSPSAKDVAAAMMADEQVRALFPSLVLTGPELLELVGPQSAIEHWRSQPLLWDHQLGGFGEHGGPTDTFAKPAEYSIFLGASDDGAKVKPWRVGTTDLGPGDTKVPKPVGWGWLVGLVAAGVGFVVVRSVYA